MLDAVARGGFTLEQRARLAVEAFAHTATYDIAVASWLGSVVAPDPDGGGFPTWVGAAWKRGDVLRYGENPHQRAAVYLDGAPRAGLAGAKQLQGKQMSYNNYVDADAARRAAFDHLEPAVAIIKHANPCGIAVGLDIAEAYRKAHATDPVSAFGGVIATNRMVSAEMAEAIGDVFTEVIVAPDYDPRRARDPVGQEEPARAQRRRPAHGLRASRRGRSPAACSCRSATRIQAEGDEPDTWTLVSGAPADAATMRDLEFAWRACRSVKSNAILLAKDGAAVGVGMGQVNRVDSARAGGRARRRSCGRFGGRVRCLLPVRRRPAGADRRRGHARSCSRAAPCATRRSSRLRRQPA